MRSFLWIITAMSLLIGKDITYKIQNLTQDSPQLISLRGVDQTQQPGNPSRTSRMIHQPYGLKTLREIFPDGLLHQNGN
uniref:Uncharacterized protein n=1 Tax=uncultured bacterium L413009-K18 TaxID=1343850 RepID=S4W7A0_9BACT|nr:hypothetical protein [uncultured bacterium L413009-K18]